MSLTKVRPYFRDKMISLGYGEWDAPFDEDQIDARSSDKGFYLPPGVIGGVTHNQSDLSMEVDQEVHFLIRGYRGHADALDDCYSEAQSIIKSMLNFVDRLKGDLTDVKLNSFSPEPYLSESDNIVRCGLSFTALVIIDVRN